MTWSFCTVSIGDLLGRVDSENCLKVVLILVGSKGGDWFEMDGPANTVLSEIGQTVAVFGWTIPW